MDQDRRRLFAPALASSLPPRPFARTPFPGRFGGAVWELVQTDRW